MKYDATNVQFYKSIVLFAFNICLHSNKYTEEMQLALGSQKRSTDQQKEESKQTNKIY
jgi:hypothetical protein